MVILVFFMPSLPLFLPSQAQAFYLGADKAVFQPATERVGGKEEGGNGNQTENKDVNEVTLTWPLLF